MKKKTQIHLIPTFHHDIAYLQPEWNYTARATAIMEKAVELMAKDETYTFTVEQVYFFKEYWEKHPQQQEMLKKFVENGQLHFAPGMWAVPDMTMPSGEGLYMQATVGRRYLKELVGYDPKTAYIADCWGHHAQTPQIMKDSGYNCYVFSRCMDPEYDVENFQWQGIDGTKLNAHWMSTAYAGISFPSDEAAINKEELNWEEASAEGIMRLYNCNAAHCGDAVQIVPVGGDMMYPASSSLEIVKKLQQDESVPPMEFSSFEAAINEIDFTKNPVWDKEFISSQKGSFATNIQIKQYNRKLENLLYALEALCVQKGVKMDFSKEWELVLKNQFHDIICGTICDEALVQALAEYEDTLQSLLAKQKELGISAFYNANNFPVTQLMDGKLLEAEAFSFAKETELPEQAECALPEAFENAFYRAEFDKRGYICKLVEKKSGTVLADHPEVPFGSLQMQVDNGDNWVEFETPNEKDIQLYWDNRPDPYDRKGMTTHPRIEVSRDGVKSVKAYCQGEEVLQVVQEGLLKYWIAEIPFRITATYNKKSPRIDYHTELTCKGKHLRVRAAFPMAYKEGCVRHQVPYAIVERGEGVQSLDMFMDYATENAGAALMNRGIYTNNTEQGIMMLTLLRAVAMEYKCQSELSFNLGKTITCEYSLMPHALNGDDELWQQALAFNRPLLKTGLGDMNGFKVDGAYLSALRHDNDAVFARVYNGLASATTAVITVPEGYTAWALTDGCMEPGEKKPVVDGKLEIPLSAYKVQGVKFF